MNDSSADLPIQSFIKPFWTPARIAFWSIFLGSILIFFGQAWFRMIRMPGGSYGGTLPAATPAERARAERLRKHVNVLATQIGARSLAARDGLERAERYVEGELRASGYEVRREAFTARGFECTNFVAEATGRSKPNEIVVVGAHYDSYLHTRAANDNASGVAAMLELAARLHGHSLARTVRFVAFTNEEPPFFTSDDMGSVVNAQRAKARGDDIVAMMSLETMGHYDSSAGSQQYPYPLSLFYPDRGDFIAFVSRTEDGTLVRRAIDRFRDTTNFPSEGAAMPSDLPGIDWSDHRSFWQIGVPALVVTDSATFRDAAYHTDNDTEDRIDYPRLARVVAGVEHVVRDWLVIDRDELL